MTSFPSELLYIPKNKAGKGLKCPTDITTSSKMTIIHRAQLQSRHAASIAIGMLMRPQRHQQPHWSRSEGGPLLLPMDDTPNGWALSLLQHLEELGMEIILTPTPLSEVLSPTHSIVDQLAGITMDQQKLLTAIGIHQDQAAPDDRN